MTDEQAAEIAPQSDIVAARELLQKMLERYSSYHDHKESMAYAGIALFGAVAGSVVLSDAWPPTHWGVYREILGAAAVTAVWIIVLLYLRFQLHNRRFAAIRVAGCDRLLLRWRMNPPRITDLRPKKSEADPPGWTAKLSDWLIPHADSVSAIERKEAEAFYPAALVAEWEARRGKTNAVKHERLVIVAGWLLWAAALAATFWRAG